MYIVFKTLESTFLVPIGYELESLSELHYFFYRKYVSYDANNYFNTYSQLKKM